MNTPPPSNSSVPIDYKSFHECQKYYYTSWGALAGRAIVSILTWRTIQLAWPQLARPRVLIPIAVITLVGYVIERKCATIQENYNELFWSKCSPHDIAQIIGTTVEKAQKIAQSYLNRG